MLKNERPRSGFTLLELLVVTSIVCILAALIVGACARAKAKANETVCRSNLRQLGMAMQMYLSDNRGRFPKHARVVRTDRYGIEYWGDGWVRKLESYATPKVFECPSDPGYRRYLAGGNASELDGALSDYVLYPGVHVVRTNGSQVVVIVSAEGAIRKPTETFLFYDTPWPRKEGPPALHSGGANYCFVDGHVRWLSVREAEAVHDRMEFK